MPFNKSNLYNIYFYIRYNTTLRPDLLFKYFDVNFNLTKFNVKYKYYIIIKKTFIGPYRQKEQSEIKFKYLNSKSNDLNESSCIKSIETCNVTHIHKSMGVVMELRKHKHKSSNDANETFKLVYSGDCRPSDKLVKFLEAIFGSLTFQLIFQNSLLRMKMSIQASIQKKDSFYKS